MCASSPARLAHTHKYVSRGILGGLYVPVRLANEALIKNAHTRGLLQRNQMRHKTILLLHRQVERANVDGAPEKMLRAGCVWTVVSTGDHQHRAEVGKVHRRGRGEEGLQLHGQFSDATNPLGSTISAKRLPFTVMNTCDVRPSGSSTGAVSTAVSCAAGFGTATHLLMRHVWS